MQLSRSMLGLVALATLIPCSVFESQARASNLAQEIQRAARDPYWLKLLHWRGTHDWGNSRVDGDGFFFSPDKGRTAETELKATIEAFKSESLEVGKLKQHPLCAFPERARFIREALGLEFRKRECPKLDEFMARFKAQSATLVFSSAYPNNPGSMFGHTFLRINSKAPEKTAAGDQAKLDFLDYGISYAAAVSDDENPFAFMALGIAGGYQGQFSMLPYYSKVSEYTNSESRDVWEYDLDLNPEQTRRMLQHVWEIETNAHFNYFFFDENCAYQLLVLLEVARPDWDLSGFLIYVIPGETVKRLMNIPGAVTRIKYRPSLRKKLVERFASLTPAEKEEAYALISGARAPESAESVAALDAAMARLFYEKQRDGAGYPQESARRLASLRLARAKMGQVQDSREPATVLTIAPDDPRDFGSRPEVGNHPYRLGTSSGLLESEYFQELQFKFAYHDLLNSDRGYVPFSQIDFPGVVLRYEPRRSRLRVEEAPLITVRSLFPISEIEKKPSWGFQLGVETPRDFCDTCNTLRLDLQGGLTLGAFENSWVINPSATGMFEVFSKIGVRGGPGAELLTIWEVARPFKLLALGQLRTDLFQSSRPRTFRVYRAAAAYTFSRSWDARAQYEWLHSSLRSLDEAKLTLNFYF